MAKLEYLFVGARRADGTRSTRVAAQREDGGADVMVRALPRERASCYATPAAVVVAVEQEHGRWLVDGIRCRFDKVWDENGVPERDVDPMLHGGGAAVHFGAWRLMGTHELEHVSRLTAALQSKTEVARDLGKKVARAQLAASRWRDRYKRGKAALDDARRVLTRPLVARLKAATQELGAVKARLVAASGLIDDSFESVIAVHRQDATNGPAREQGARELYETIRACVRHVCGLGVRSRGGASLPATGSRWRHRVTGACVTVFVADGGALPVVHYTDDAAVRWKALSLDEFVSIYEPVQDA